MPRIHNKYQVTGIPCSLHAHSERDATQVLQGQILKEQWPFKADDSFEKNLSLNTALSSLLQREERTPLKPLRQLSPSKCIINVPMDVPISQVDMGESLQ